MLETRAETVARLRSGDEGRFCGQVEVVELPSETLELVAVQCDFVPFTPTDAFMELLGLSTSFTFSGGEVVAMGEEGLGVTVTKFFEASSWTGGRGARYLTLACCG